MKVTKLIREYVTEEVSKVYDAKVNPYSEQAEIDKEELKKFEKELRNQQQALIDEFCSKTQLFNHWNYVPASANAQCPGISYLYTQSMIDEAKWNKENNRLKNAKIREIIVNLELGANRQELNDMIAKLMEE